MSDLMKLAEAWKEMALQAKDATGLREHQKCSAEARKLYAALAAEVQRVEAENAALRAQVERMRSAAQVFSALCDLIFDEGWDDRDELELYAPIDDGGQLLHRFRVGQFRALASEVKP